MGPIWAGVALQAQDLNSEPFLICLHSRSMSQRDSGSGICKSQGAQLTHFRMGPFSPNYTFAGSFHCGEEPLPQPALPGRT